MLEKLKGIDSQVAQRIKELSDKNSECASINDALNRKNIDLTNAQNDLANLETTRTSIVADISNKSGIVDDLRNRLQKA